MAVTYKPYVQPDKEIRTTLTEIGHIFISIIDHEIIFLRQDFLVKYQIHKQNGNDIFSLDRIKKFL